MSSQYSAFDQANPNQIGNLLQSAKLGRLLLGQLPQVRRKVDLSVASPYALATLGVFQLPEEGKASTIQAAYARAGGVALGPLTIVAPGVTPATTQIAVTPNGDIACLLSDAYTSVDILFTPERGDSLGLDRDGNVNNVSAPGNVYPVVSNVITLPATLTARGVVLLMEAEALTGTSTGKKIVLAPGAGAPAAGQARLNLAKSTITFAVADAVTRARIKLLVCAADDLGNILTATQSII